jgi:hypothetical protein
MLKLKKWLTVLPFVSSLCVLKVFCTAVAAIEIISKYKTTV